MSTQDILCGPRCEPTQIYAGDTVQWRRCFDGYSASAGYTLAYTIINRTATHQVSGSMVVGDGDAFAVTIPAATSAAWVAGQYRWQAYIADGSGNRYTVGEGVLEVLPNLQAQGSGYDDREDDEKILDAIIALLSGKVLAGDAQRYMIHGRELQRYTFAELEKLRCQYALRVRRLRVRRGERVSARTIRTGFGG